MKSLLLALCAVLLASPFASTPAQAQAVTDKPLRLIVPFSPGGGSDIMARLIATPLGEKLGVAVVVDNKPGAAGAIAAQLTARAPGDGKTLMLGTTSEIGINPSLYPNLPYNVSRDFAPVTTLASAPMVLVVHPSSPVKNVNDLIRLAQTTPGGISYGSGGTGSSSHLGGELFCYQAKIRMTHIPYKGSGPAIADIVGSQREMITFATLTSVAALVQADKLRIIAVATKERVPLIPNVPTFIESGMPDYAWDQWYGLVAPAATPADVVRTLYTAVREVMQQPAILEALNKQALTPAVRTPQQFSEFIRQDEARWASVIKFARVTPDQ